MTQGSVCSQGFVLYLVPPKQSGIPMDGCGVLRAVEIGTSLGRYPDFPLLLSHSYHVPLPIPSLLLYATDTGLRRLISDYTGFDR